MEAGEMDAARWRGPIDQILYAVMFRASLDDSTVDQLARDIVGRRALRDGPAGYAETIPPALALTDRLTASFDTPHDETGFRDFLARLARRLEESKPWPEPAFVGLPADRLADLGGMRPVARIDESLIGLEGRLGEMFRPLPTDPSRYGLALRLRTGETGGLVGSYRPGEPVTLLGGATADPARTVAAFRAATGVGPDLVKPTSNA